MTSLHANNPLTDDTAALAGKVLMVSLDSIDNEISRLQGRLGTLSFQQLQLRTSLESHRSLLSPIRRLLPEILQEIFCHCLPTAHNAVMSATEAPLVLGRVCSQWRGIAYSTPELWASIHITPILPPHLTFPKDRRAISLQHAAAAWLSRSGTLPLSISLISFDSMETDQTRLYFDLIKPYAHRWRSIHFSVYRFHWIMFFDCFDVSEVPLLESLYIRSDDEPMARDLVPIMSRPNSILRAPRLHALSLPSYSTDILKLGIQLQNFTSLGIKDSCLLPPRDITIILGRCPNLRACAISIWTPPRRFGSYAPFPIVPIATVIMPKLESLAISGGASIHQYTNHLLKNLVTPALRHLSIPLPPRPVGGTTSEPDNIYGSLSSFLQHLVDPLEELQMSFRMPTSKYTADVLSLVPGLKRLSLIGYRTFSRSVEEVIPSPGEHNYVLAQLTPGNDWGGIPSSQPSDQHSRTLTCLCPELEVLHYMNAKVSDNELLCFLRSRTVEHSEHNVSHIRMFSVRFFRQEQDSAKETDSDLRQGIEVLERETGVRVDCRYNELSRSSLEPFRPSTPIYSPFDGLPPMIPSNWVSETGSGWHYFGF